MSGNRRRLDYLVFVGISYDLDSLFDAVEPQVAIEGLVHGLARRIIVQSRSAVSRLGAAAASFLQAGELA